MNRVTLLVACLAFAASSPALASNATTAPSATAAVKDFYGWYLVQPNHEWTAHLSQIKSTFDPTLYTMLQTVLHSKANQEEPVMDFDPFVNAQWDATSYAFGNAGRQRGRSAYPRHAQSRRTPKPEDDAHRRLANGRIGPLAHLQLHLRCNVQSARLPAQTAAERRELTAHSRTRESSRREFKSKRSKIAAICVSTVRSPIASISAISRLLLPSTARRATSVSRGVSRSAPARCRARRRASAKTPLVADVAMPARRARPASAKRPAISRLEPRSQGQPIFSKALCGVARQRLCGSSVSRSLRHPRVEEREVRARDRVIGIGGRPFESTTVLWQPPPRRYSLPTDRATITPVRPANLRKRARTQRSGRALCRSRRNRRPRCRPRDRCFRFARPKRDGDRIDNRVVRDSLVVHLQIGQAHADARRTALHHWAATAFQATFVQTRARPRDRPSGDRRTPTRS